MSKLNLKSCACLFVAAITMHNIEEALFLPAWGNSVGVKIPSSEFIFAVVVLTVLAYVSSYLAMQGAARGVWAYFYTGYALAMFLNVFLPHLFASILMREYAPGTGTALLFVLPASSLVLYKSIQCRFVDLGTFYKVGPIVVLGIASSVPLLFALWRVLSR